jgi:TolA-binding protein
MRRECTFPSMPESNSGDDSISSLTDQIQQAQGRVNALGELISEAMAQMYRAMKRLEQLQAEAEPFRHFINNELEAEL